MKSAPTKLPKLTKKQAGFVKDYLETGNGTQAALKNYDTTKPEVANAIAVENLQKPSIQAYLESKSNRAAERVVELSEQKENLSVALGASKDILDRAGYAPVEKSQNINVNIEIETTERLRKIAEKLKNMDL